MKRPMYGARVRAGERVEAGQSLVEIVAGSLVIDLPEEQALEADDPYAQYQVPDDLMW